MAKRGRRSRYTTTGNSARKQTKLGRKSAQAAQPETGRERYAAPMRLPERSFLDGFTSREAREYHDAKPMLPAVNKPEQNSLAVLDLDPLYEAISEMHSRIQEAEQNRQRSQEARDILEAEINAVAMMAEEAERELAVAAKRAVALKHEAEQVSLEGQELHQQLSEEEEYWQGRLLKEQRLLEDTTQKLRIAEEETLRISRAKEVAARMNEREMWRLGGSKQGLWLHRRRIQGNALSMTRGKDGDWHMPKMVPNSGATFGQNMLEREQKLYGAYSTVDKERLDILSESAQTLAERQSRQLEEDFLEQLAAREVARHMADAAESLVTPFAEDPVVEAPVAEIPVPEVPVAEDPVVEAPAAEAPVAEAPVVEAPAAEDPVAEAPIVAAPVTVAPIFTAPSPVATFAATPPAAAPTATASGEEPQAAAATDDDDKEPVRVIKERRLVAKLDFGTKEQVRVIKERRLIAVPFIAPNDEEKNQTHSQMREKIQRLWPLNSAASGSQPGPAAMKQEPVETPQPEEKPTIPAEPVPLFVLPNLHNSTNEQNDAAEPIEANEQSDVAEPIEANEQSDATEPIEANEQNSDTPYTEDTVEAVSIEETVLPTEEEAAVQNQAIHTEQASSLLNEYMLKALRKIEAGQEETETGSAATLEQSTPQASEQPDAATAQTFTSQAEEDALMAAQKLPEGDDPLQFLAMRAATYTGTGTATAAAKPQEQEQSSEDEDIQRLTQQANILARQHLTQQQSQATPQEQPVSSENIVQKVAEETGRQDQLIKEQQTAEMAIAAAMSAARKAAQSAMAISEQVNQQIPAVDPRGLAEDDRPYSVERIIADALSKAAVAEQYRR